jgi:selenide, water dikinase
MNPMNPLNRRLTEYSSCGGCASKLAAGELAQVIGSLDISSDPRVLIDYRTSDDAGVFAIDGDRALVQTVDFFTPIVDDPFVYGQIAAANALSDVYAMGGRPLTALAITAFPKDADREILKAIFAGGSDKLREANTALLGGHTVQDTEIKFGYAVTGDVTTAEVWSNAGAQPGDVLLLTKSLGTGIISTALRFGRASSRAIEAAVRSMTTLNRAASEALRSLGNGAVHACTDVTGFSLIGHASEMAVASGCTVDIASGAVPLLPGVLELVDGNVPGGGRTNAEYFGERAEVDAAIDPALLQILYDPQTSGGLLVAVHPATVDRAVQALAAAGVTGTPIGTVRSVGARPVIVRTG